MILLLLPSATAMGQESDVAETAAHDDDTPVDTDAMVQTARDRISPIQRCKAAAADEILVCGNDTQDNRLSPELRAISGVGRSTRDTVPRAPEARALTLDKLPYNWIGRNGILFPRPKPNPLLEHVRAMEAARAADAAAEPGTMDSSEDAAAPVPQE